MSGFQEQGAIAVRIRLDLRLMVMLLRYWNMDPIYGLLIAFLLNGREMDSLFP